ncbi:hypothetical protein [Brevundimonas subvibrioides]|uniref:Phage tail protein n=1 Tax=Brevundimonas subvibrioides (strain ATCC 15264 / DSM 4735 / LMG 14903 / NBRC 16000 / CB 81) TaxID=633149 RepID=D9QFZ6_BRESC|nr:hypothetical protein [Brevundimonas subvibrioides]ADL00710.1 hypothetical protein Bresu_1398 [Brevundimonas subvibrioides ATCC 15264]
MADPIQLSEALDALGVPNATAVADSIAAAITALKGGVAGSGDTLKKLSDLIAAKPSSADVSTAITTAISALVNGAPGALDTLKEIADALAADEGALAALVTTVGTKAAILDTINTQTGTAYTLQASDAGKVVELNNAAAVTVTVPNTLAVGFNCILSQTGAGLVTVAAGAGATVNAQAGLKSPGQWGEMSLRVRANIGGTAAAAVLGGGVA